MDELLLGTEEPEDVHGLLDEARSGDAGSGLGAIGILKIWLELREGDLVEVARNQGRSWGWIASCLGRARQGVWEKYRDASDGDSCVLDLDAETRQERLIRIGQHVEAVRSLINVVEPSSPDQSKWRSATALLRQALTGFSVEELPSTHQLAQEVGRRVDELSTAGEARKEIGEALAVLGA
jgi:hypothetical protein